MYLSISVEVSIGTKREYLSTSTYTLYPLPHRAGRSNHVFQPAPKLVIILVQFVFSAVDPRLNLNHAQTQAPPRNLLYLSFQFCQHHRVITRLRRLRGNDPLPPALCWFPPASFITHYLSPMVLAYNYPQSPHRAPRKRTYKHHRPHTIAQPRGIHNPLPAQLMMAPLPDIDIAAILALRLSLLYPPVVWGGP